MQQFVRPRQRIGAAERDHAGQGVERPIIPLRIDDAN